MPIRALSAVVPDAVLDFLDAAVSPRGRDHWRWKYDGAPASSCSAFYWEDDGGGVLGFIGLMRTTLCTIAGRHAAAWFVDWHVTEGAGGAGVGLALLRKAESDAGILLTLRGSADTRRILPRLGWRESRAPTTWVRPLTARFLSDWAARRLPRPLRPVTAALGNAASVLFGAPAPVVPAGFALVDVERFGSEQDDVWRCRVAEFAPAMTRDGAYLDHFCADDPGGGYRMRVARRNGEAVGHLVWRIDDRRGLQRGRIVDLLWPRTDRRVADWLVGAACRELAEAGADYVECVASVADLADALRRLRFRPRDTVALWYHRVPEEAPPETWYVTFLDCDRAYR